MKKGKGTMGRRSARISLALPANRTPAWILASSVAVAAALSACGAAEDPNDRNVGEFVPPDSVDQDGVDQPAAPTPEEEMQKLLDQRTLDYGEALRTASLKLRDRLPDFSEIQEIDSASGDAAKKAAYERLIDEMIESAEFSQVMIKFWKDTFRTAQVGAPQNNVDRNAAATFAAQIIVEGRNFTEMLTATTDTCPTYDAEENTFTPQECALPTNGMAGPTVGVLTDPGLQSQYYANMAFRRVRFVQETFICSKFPAEFSDNPVPMGNGIFTGAIPLESITGLDNNPDARVDFQETKAVVCGNCHVNMNHIAPLFLNWDENGALRNGPRVKVPIPGEPNAQETDFLPPGEGLLWRANVPITDMASLGKAIAEDPDTARCAVNRVWNYAMSRGDIVDNLASVPNPVTQPYVDKFVANGMNLKATIQDVFKSEDFTKF